MSEAIQQDVSRDGREADIDEIAERLMKERGGPEEEEETEEPEEQEETQDEPETEEEEEDEPGAAEEPEEELITLKVNGEEVQVPLSKVKDAGVRTLQKETAADKRLQEAAEREKAIAQREKEIQEYYQRLATQQQGAEEKPDATQEIDDALVEAIQFGDTEQAKAALAKLRQQTPAQDVQQALAQVEQRVIQRMKVEQHNQDIARKFQAPPDQGGFGDIAGDPYLYQMAANYVNKARQNGDTRMGWDLYEEAGNEVRKWRDGLIGKHNPTPSLDEKKAAKKKIDNIKTTTARQTKVEEKEPTRQDIIKEMAKSRAI